MLKLRRKEHQWFDIVHVATGETMRICWERNGNTANLCFDDDARHFAIVRPERPDRSILNERCPEPSGNAVTPSA